MTIYLCTAQGLLNNSFPWSFRSYVVSGLSEASAATAFDNGIKAAWNNAGLNALIPASTKLSQTITATLDSSFHQISETVVADNLVGTGVQALPYECAHVITWRTGFAQKMAHGRWFFPGLAVTALATNGYVLSAATQTTMQTALNAYLTSIRGSLTMVIRHRKLGTTENVTKGDIPDVINVQRRRADKRVPTRVTLTV